MCSKKDFRVLQGSFKDVARKFQGCFKEVWRVFQGSFKNVLRKCQGYWKKVSNVFQEIKKKVSRTFQECFNEVLFCNFVLARISSQLPEQKEGLFFVLIVIVCTTLISIILFCPYLFLHWTCWLWMMRLVWTPYRRLERRGG